MAGLGNPYAPYSEIFPQGAPNFFYQYNGTPMQTPGTFGKPYSGFSNLWYQNGLNSLRPQNFIASMTNKRNMVDGPGFVYKDDAGNTGWVSKIEDVPLLDNGDRVQHAPLQVVDPNWQPGFFDNMSNLDLMNFGLGALGAGWGLYNGIQQNHMARAAMRNQEKWAQKNYNAQLGSMLQNRQDTLAARYQGEGRLDADGINAAVNSGVSSLESGLRNGTAGSLGTYNIRDYLGNTDYSGLGSSSTNGMASTATIPAAGTRPEDEKQ